MITLSARDIMVTRLVTLSTSMDVHDAVKLLLKNRISGAPVVDETGRYLGVFSERCSLGVILDSAYEQLPTHDVGSFMDTDAETVTADTQILSIAQLFLLSNARRVPVVDEDGQLLGQISRRDVIQAAMKQLDQTPVRESSILYLSAIFDRQDSPIS